MTVFSCSKKYLVNVEKLDRSVTLSNYVSYYTEKTVLSNQQKYFVSI